MPANSMVHFAHLSATTSVGACFVMASFYVLSLYLWSAPNRYNRNHPSVIKRRFVSVITSSLASLLLVYSLAASPLSHHHHHKAHSLSDWIGTSVRVWQVSVAAVLASLLLTLVLFAGPLCQLVVESYRDFLLDLGFDDDDDDDDGNNKKASLLNFVRTSWALQGAQLRSAWRDVCFWRNYVVSPFTEEFVFRSCMLPLVVPHVGTASAMLVVPLFFGVAHLHHFVEGYMLGERALHVLLAQNLFQFAYTYVFGVYSSYLFVRTGCLYASFASHSLCNWFGFPNVLELCADADEAFADIAARFARHKRATRLAKSFWRWARHIVGATYVLGLLAFVASAAALTEPALFDNRVFS